MRNIRKRLVGKYEGKILIRRARRRWEDNIKMDLREIGKIYTGLIWLSRDQWRFLVNTVMYFWVPQ
jgi:hypothetical protein